MKKIKQLGLVIMIAVSALMIVACGSTLQAQNLESITIKHELGETVLDRKPEKIIIFDYGVLDTLDKIGEDIIGLPKKTIPEYLDKYKGEDYVDVGELKEPNFEKVYELKPDLIIISGRQADSYDEFTKIAPTVYLEIDGGDYINSFKNSMKIIGEIFEKEELLAQEVRNIEEAISNLNEEARSNGKNGLFIMANDGNLSAFGVGSRFGILHNEFGVTPVDESIAPSSHGDKISFEYIVEKDPDYIYVMDRAAIAGGDISAVQVMDNDLIKSTSAYKNNQIIYLDAHVWYVSSGGLTGTMKMVEEIQSSFD